MKDEIIQITSENLKTLIVDGLKNALQPKEHPEYVTRKYVADEMLHCSTNTVDIYSEKGILRRYKIEGRILFIRQEVEDAIVEVKMSKTA